MDQRLNDFMTEFESETYPNPFAGFERVWMDRAAFELRPFDGKIHLGCIRSLFRGKGHGSEALDWIISLADKHGVILEGSIKPVGQTKPRLNTAQLAAWYRRHGFKVTRRTEISRAPKVG